MRCVKKHQKYNHGEAENSTTWFSNTNTLLCLCIKLAHMWLNMPKWDTSLKGDIMIFLHFYIEQTETNKISYHMFWYSKNSWRYVSLKWNNFIHVEKKLRRKRTSKFCLLFSCYELALIRATCFIFFLLHRIGNGIFSNNIYDILLLFCQKIN